MTRAEIEKDIFEESYNLDYQFIMRSDGAFPFWSNKKVVDVVIQQVNAALDEAADEIAAVCNCDDKVRALKVQS